MNDEQEKNLTLRQMLGSVLAAALGVQSGKNRARDFSHGKPSHFIILGVGFTVLFVLIVLGVVKLVLYLAGLQPLLVAHPENCRSHGEHDQGKYRRGIHNTVALVISHGTSPLAATVAACSSRS